MQTLTPTPRRPAALLLAGCGFVAAFAWGPGRDAVAGDVAAGPVVRVAPARPLEPADVTARGAAAVPPPPFDPLDPSRSAPSSSLQGPSAGGPVRPWPGVGGFARPPQPQPTRSETPTTAPGQPPAGRSVTGWVTDQAKAVRNLVAGPPEPPPRPRVGVLTITPVAATAQPRPAVVPVAAGPVAAAPFRGTSVTGAPAYAGNPAYRWYGWGTTTPGANPFAPAGDYPKGSANWYAMTGATPGAFPVPVTNAFRPPPGGVPPAYLAAAPSPTSRPSTTPLVPPPAPRPIAESQPTRGGSPPLRPSPPRAADTTWQPASTPLMPPVPPSAPVPSPPPAPPPPTDTKWQPAAGPVVRGQQPTTDDAPDFGPLVRAACTGLVSSVAVTPAGPRTVVVSFSATTETLAEIAARAVSNIPDLRPYRVEFRATLTGR